MSNKLRGDLIWIEVSKKAIKSNIAALRTCIGRNVALGLAVKANAYGHGIREIGALAAQSGADLLCVNSLEEAISLQTSKIKTPIYVMGYTQKSSLPELVKAGLQTVVYNTETVNLLGSIAKKIQKKVDIHIKVETGNNRQGIDKNQLLAFINLIKKWEYLHIKGICTHFSNIEDITLQSAEFRLTGYPVKQLQQFKQMLDLLAQNGIHTPLIHAANSAATLLFPETHFSMVRAGLAVYGMWPSDSTKQYAEKLHPGIMLTPIMKWKTRIAQIKTVSKGSYIGYGCTYKTKQATRLAILPVGYYDGYDRHFSNKTNVLVCGKRAPVRGRVCMNITIVDVTRIPEAKLEDEVTLLGGQGDQRITAEELAVACGTINYEITTRIREGIPRIVV